MANFCEYCGSAVKPGHLYCENCGSPVAGHQAAAQSGPAAGESWSAQPIPPVQVIGDSGKSAVTRAWEDLSCDKSNFGRVAVLALLEMIPIVNLFVTGYVLKWGVGATRSSDKSLPEQYFSEFVLGFYALVVSLVWGIVIGIIGQIPVLGAIAALFLAPLLILCLMRVGMFGSVSAGFEITKAWNLYRNKMGEVAFAFWIPVLIGMVAIFACTLVASFFGGISLVTLSGHGPVFSGIGALGVLVSLLCGYVIMVASVMSNLVAERAMGYVIAENAPDWVRESLVTKPTL